LPEGLSWLALHFSADTDIRLMDDEASIRVDEYEFFQGGGAAIMMDELNLAPIGIRYLRQQLRELSGAV
jgi:chitin disaccharide deacetylase